MAGAAAYMRSAESSPKGGSRVTAGGNTTDDRKIPAHVAVIGLLLPALVLFSLDRAKFKMVVGVS